MGHLKKKYIYVFYQSTLLYCKQFTEVLMVLSRIVTLYPVTATALVCEEFSFTIQSFHTRKFLLSDD
jgi:hypothetical protein